MSIAKILEGKNIEEFIIIGDSLDKEVKLANAIGMESIWLNESYKKIPKDNELKPTYEIHIKEHRLPAQEKMRITATRLVKHAAPAPCRHPCLVCEEVRYNKPFVPGLRHQFLNSLPSLDQIHQRCTTLFIHSPAYSTTPCQSFQFRHEGVPQDGGSQKESCTSEAPGLSPF